VSLAKKMGEMYVEISPRQTRQFPNAKEVLEELKKMGYHLHIITNGFEEVQYIKLENCGLREYFDVIVCSEAVGKNKPALAIFNYALEQANCIAENAMMIGDDYIADVSGGLKAGLQAILFDPHLRSTEKYEFTIQNLNELPLLATKLLRI